MMTQISREQKRINTRTPEFTEFPLSFNLLLIRMNEQMNERLARDAPV